MTYSEFKQGQTKQAFAGTAAAVLGANPAVSATVAGAAAHPGVAIPATALGSFATGVKAYKGLLGDKLNKVYENQQNQINDTAKTYREYLKWRNSRDQKKPMAVPAAKQKSE